MVAQEENKIEIEQDALQHIPFFDDEYIKYEECKEYFFEHFSRYSVIGYPIASCVLAVYDDHETSMNENGMYTFIGLIAGMIRMMEQDEIHTDVAYALNIDIRDFETGNYDDLFTPEDLVLIKKDMATIKDYIGQYPELLLDENENLVFTKGEFTKIRKTMMDGNKLIVLDEFIDK